MPLETVSESDITPGAEIVKLNKEKEEFGQAITGVTLATCYAAAASMSWNPMGWGAAAVCAAIGMAVCSVAKNVVPRSRTGTPNDKNAKYGVEICLFSTSF